MNQDPLPKVHRRTRSRDKTEAAIAPMAYPAFADESLVHWEGRVPKYSSFRTKAQLPLDTRSPVSQLNSFCPNAGSAERMILHDSTVDHEGGISPYIRRH